MNVEMFRKDGNDYRNWQYKAEDLIKAGEKLYCLGDFTIPVMLMAMGIECYLKAIFTKQGNEIINNDAKFNKAIDTKHNIKKLMSLTSIDFTNDALLEKLSHAITYWGRYPIPRKHSEHREKKAPRQTGGIPPITCWSEEEHKELMRLIALLEKNLEKT